MTATTALLPQACPPPWAVRAAGQAAAARTTARALTLRVPLVAGDEWFWELVGVDEVEQPTQAPLTDDRRAWALVALPALLVVQAAVAGALRLAVPGLVVLGELLGACVLLAYLDGRRLRRSSVRAPSPWAALLPPLYLFRRSAVTRDARILLAWFAVAAAATWASVVVDAHLAPVPLQSRTVESTLYEQLFEGRLPLDAQTAAINCPAFSARWVGQDFRCTAQDRRRAVPVEVSVVNRQGALTWQVLEGTP